VVKGRAQAFGGPARAQVEAVNDMAGLQQGLRGSADVTGPGGAFQPVHEHGFVARARRALGNHQNLNPGFGLVEPALGRIAALARPSRPEVRHDRQQPRGTEQGTEGRQASW
jgi:hypothetical protein